MPIKISYILPCYNVAPYIGRCLDSIAHQDIPLDEMEIICVDDCSTDNTVDLIRQYQQSMPNIVLIQHETNKTSGGARNTGIENARGEYIWFVDPDDSIVENRAGKLYSTAKNRDCDQLVMNINVVDEQGLVHPELKACGIDTIHSGVEYIQQHAGSLGLYSVIAVYKSLYRRAFLLKHNLRYPQIKASQDVVFVWRAMLEAKRVSAIDDVCYNYIRRVNSMTGRKGKLKPYAVLSQSLLFAYELYKIADEYRSVDAGIMSKVYQELRNSLNGASRDVLRMPHDGRKAFYKGMCENKHMIDALWKYMNRKTRNIFRYKLPIGLWLLLLTIYILHET